MITLQRKQQGLSLVEIMVALALSSLLVTALYRIVLGNQQGMALTEAYAKTQDAMRSAFDVLESDIRMAGYRGCAHSSVNINSRLNPNSPGYVTFLHDYSNVLEAIDNYSASSPSIPGNITPSLGGDVFISRAAVPIDMVVANDMVLGANNFDVAGNTTQLSNIEPGQIILVSDCKDADIFSLSGKVSNPTNKQLYHMQSVTGGPSNNSATLSKAYKAGSQVLLMNTVVYFIAPSSLITNVNSLYRYEALSGSGEDAKELVPYVQDMQLRFSVDTNDDREPDTYMTAAEIAAASLSMTENVYAVHITLTIATEISCALPNARENCLVPQQYQRLVYIRNSGSRS